MSVTILDEPIRTAKTEAGDDAIRTAHAAFQRGDLPLALAAWARALRAEPDNPTALYNAGITRFRMIEHAAARPYFARVTELRPDMALPWFAHAACCLMARDHDAALAGYTRAAEIAPNNARFAHGLATVRSIMGDKLGALAGFRRAQELAPGYAWARFSEGVTLAQMGRWSEAWPAMEARKLIGVTSRPLTDRPMWDGRSLNGQSILLRTEQGIGDVIMAARYVDAVRAVGGDVTLETRPELARLFGCLGVPQIEVNTEPPLTDWYDDLLSLPLRFGTEPHSEPWDGAYVAADASLVADWQRALAGVQRPRVGLCWAGGTPPGDPSGLAIDLRRSLTPEQVAPIVAVPGVSFVSLVPEQVAPAGVLDLTGRIRDMADTAALVACLDLVITVDTAIVHLAGAMGRPVWMLDRFDHCWRWLPNRETSPWYPSLRIFRQETLCAWGPVIDRAAVELERWASEVRRALAG